MILNNSHQTIPINLISNRTNKQTITVIPIEYSNTYENWYSYVSMIVPVINIGKNSRKMKPNRKLFVTACQSSTPYHLQPFEALALDKTFPWTVIHFRFYFKDVGYFTKKNMYSFWESTAQYVVLYHGHLELNGNVLNMHISLTSNPMPIAWVT